MAFTMLIFLRIGVLTNTHTKVYAACSGHQFGNPNQKHGLP